MQFSHLHVHTQYSLLDGAASIKSLYKKAEKHKMPALAITDHGNMFGAFHFVAEAWKNTKSVGFDENGKEKKVPVVKPIVGCEFYMVENRHVRSFTKPAKDNRYHQLFLAKNAEGYQNLVKLTSMGFIEGMYSKYPRIDKELVVQYHKGLIATTCCLGAMVPQAVLNSGEEAAEKEFKWWLDLFGEDYYVELQRHSMPEQEQVNAVLLKLAKKYNVPIIASNDSHYTEKDDWNAHDILLCINTGEKQSTPGMDDFTDESNEGGKRNVRFKFPNNEFYFKTTDEMSRLFHDIPHAIDNTNAIVDKIDTLNLKRDILLPNFPIPAEFKTSEDDKLNQWNYLHHITYEGARKRYGEIDEVTRERLDFELFTIKTMGFAGYFLIVSDFIKAGRDLGVFIGPGRGSAAGSAVAYCIGITNIDPIKYNLLFERFLNPDRKSMPDIDTDFDDEGRQKVIDYVVDKYGKSQVAQIITYGTMAAKSSIKDVARVLDLPLSESNLLAKLVPEKVGTSLGRVLKAPITNDDAKDGEKSLEAKEQYGPDDIGRIRELRTIYAGNDMRATILKEAEKLEGSARNTGIHAAGIIIAPEDLTGLIPVSTAKDSELWVTQFDGSIIESAGVIKMDFLGLKTLSIIKSALVMIHKNHGLTINIDDIALDDQKVYALYQRGETNSTFQFESSGMQKYLIELKPDKFDDLIAMNALYRPGPMGYIPSFVARKHGLEEIAYDLADMEEYLAETYGITVYQEQVMLLSQKLGGFSKGDADVLRKAMGKKDRPTLDKLKPQFMEGAKAKGHPIKVLEKIWTDWEAFAQYAFNKSHSTCYALVAYQTGFLKAYYPSEYMAAVLNHNTNNLEKLTFHMEECKRMGINVLPPDVNESNQGFSVNKNGDIRFGLSGLKNMGEAAVENIIAERETAGLYKDIFEFMKRINLQKVTKRSMESLVYSGSFDGFALHRAQYFHKGNDDKLNQLEKIILYAQQANASKDNHLNTLFGDLGSVMDVPLPKLSNCLEWSLPEKLDHEKEVTSMYLSGHPLDNYRLELSHPSICPVATFNEFIADKGKTVIDKTLRIAGMVSKVRHGLTKKGDGYGIIELEDFTGKVELAFFAEAYLRNREMLASEAKIVVSGSFQMGNYDSEARFRPGSVSLLQSLVSQSVKRIFLRCAAGALVPAELDYLSDYMNQHPGDTKLTLEVQDPLQNIAVPMAFPQPITVTPQLTEWLGKQQLFQVELR